MLKPLLKNLGIGLTPEEKIIRRLRIERRKTLQAVQRWQEEARKATYEDLLAIGVPKREVDKLLK